MNAISFYGQLVIHSNFGFFHTLLNLWMRLDSETLFAFRQFQSGSGSFFFTWSSFVALLGHALAFDKGAGLAWLVHDGTPGSHHLLTQCCFTAQRCEAGALLPTRPGRLRARERD